MEKHCFIIFPRLYQLPRFLDFSKQLLEMSSTNICDRVAQIIANRMGSKHDKCCFPLDSFKTAILQGIS